MKHLILFVILFFGLHTQAQIIAKVEMKEKVEWICDNDNVYGLFDGFDGQVTPKCSVTEEEMEKQLNQMQFLKDNPKYKGKGMVGVYVNCKGEAIGWRISVKTKDELDEEILTVFKSFQDWSVGTLNGKKVDSSVLISYKIKRGKLTIS